MSLRIRVCCPCPHHDLISPQTVGSLKSLQSCGDFDVSVLTISGTNISSQRCMGANLGECLSVWQNEPYGEEFDFYLAVDADMEFSPDNLRNLIDRNLEIVGAAYPARRPINHWCAGHFEHGGFLVREDLFLSAAESGLRKVGWVGMGFTLIRRDVFRRLPFPWWREEVVEFAHPHTGQPSAVNLGDDVGFCINAAKAGFDVFCDCDNKVRHLVDFAPYKRIKELGGQL